MRRNCIEFIDIKIPNKAHLGVGTSLRLQSFVAPRTQSWLGLPRTCSRHCELCRSRASFFLHLPPPRNAAILSGVDVDYARFCWPRPHEFSPMPRREEPVLSHVPPLLQISCSNEPSRSHLFGSEIFAQRHRHQVWHRLYFVPPDVRRVGLEVAPESARGRANPACDDRVLAVTFRCLPSRCLFYLAAAYSSIPCAFASLPLRLPSFRLLRPSLLPRLSVFVQPEQPILAYYAALPFPLPAEELELVRLLAHSLCVIIVA
eukprot:m.217918 g.217918  ORF g.217918 m.217918 type:complete len:260 (+) comp15565_c0_seq2:3536-4315(+)